MDAAVAARVAALTDSGLVNAAGNRRALRVGAEPLETFRQYMAVFCREQAYCHFSPALVRTSSAHRRETVIWDPVEQLPREELRALQLERLRATFGVDVRSLDDVAAAVHVEGRPARGVPVRAAARSGQVARVHASSGTHGKPTVVGYTRADLEAWTELMARCMTMAGVRPGMVVHNANSYGLFTGGFGFHQGAERIGCTVMPVSGGLTAARRCCCTTSARRCWCATPSYALVIAQAVRSGDRPVEAAARARPVRRRAVDGGDARADRARAAGLRAVNFYGLSEMCGPGVATECIEARDGLHVQEDHFLVEVIDPERANRWARARRASWSSRRSPKRRCRWCAIAPATSGRWMRAVRVRAHTVRIRGFAGASTTCSSCAA